MGMAEYAGAQTVHSSPVKDEIRLRLDQQESTIRTQLKEGKLSPFQAAALRDALKSIWKQVRADYVKNGATLLTEAQKADVNRRLDESEDNEADQEEESSLKTTESIDFTPVANSPRSSGRTTAVQDSFR